MSTHELGLTAVFLTCQRSWSSVTRGVYVKVEKFQKYELNIEEDEIKRVAAFVPLTAGLGRRALKFRD